MHPTRLSPATQRIDTSEREPVYLLRCANGRYITLSTSAHYLFTQINDGVSPAELADRLGRQLGRVVSEQEVQEAYARVRGRVEAIEQRTGRRTIPGMWFRLRCLPAPAITWLSRRLSVLIHPVVATVSVVAIVFAMARTAPDSDARHSQMMDPGASFLPLFGLFVISMLTHELGHATACTRFGARPGDIGLGFYLIFPVAYSDVSEAWTLSRRQRVVVDLAGVYFQLLTGFVYLIVHHLTGGEVWQLASVLVFTVALFMLLPIFKFDGYWLLADLLGVVNLYRQIPRVFKHTKDRVRRVPTTRLPWPAWVSVAVLVFGVLSTGFLALFGLRLVLIVIGLLQDYPTRVGGLMRDLSVPPHRPATGRMHTLIGPTYVLLGVGFALTRLATVIVRALRRKGPR